MAFEPRRWLALAGALCALSACNGVLGIEEATLDSEPADGSAPAGTPTGGAMCSAPGTLVCGRSQDGSQQNAALFCESGAYAQVFACPGLESCLNSSHSTFIACGTQAVHQPYAKSGAPCGAEGGAACTFDGAIVLECVGGSWLESRHCAPSQCVAKAQSGAVQCDNGGYAVGDRCGFSAGQVVCSTDLSQILQCQGGVTSVKQSCAAGTSCTARADGALACQ
jgi:hypothetical protein